MFTSLVFAVLFAFGPSAPRMGLFPKKGFHFPCFTVLFAAGIGCGGCSAL